MSSRVNNDLRALKDDDTGIVAVPPKNKINLGKSGTSNEGITWFGSSYVGPGNLLTDQEGHFIGKALPTSAIDKVAFQHDADYYNATDVSKDNIWEIDKKAIKSALQVSDPYLGNYATAIGLVLKRGADLVDQFVTGNQTAIYPNHPNTSGKFFDPTPYINNSGVEEDPDLDWSYDGNGDPNVVPGTPEPVASSSSNHVGPTEEYWSGGTDTMATSGGGTKRGADSSSGSGSAPKRANTSLPGTGNEGAGDPDTGNPSPENAVIPRPISNTGGFTMVFRKVHTFISYGAAWKVVKHPGSNSAYFGTTSLMNVPVDQPWFYMSPSEFKVLPRGALCTSVRCRGVMRNPRTAFETNSSTSSLATLNQNKFMVKADGLNLSTRGVNRTLHFGNNTEPMDVTATEAYENHTLSYIEKMYGQTIDGQFKVSEGHCLPASYMNLPLMYNSYFCNFVNTGHNLGRMGWERFNEKITKVDASFTVGTTVVDYEYKPQCGLLTPQHDPFFDGLVSVQEPDTGAFHSFGLQNSNLEIIDDIDANSATVQRRTDNKLNHFGNTAWKRMFGNARYYTPIDCGQYVRQWDKNNHSSSVQPSVHVGVYPVHKLTTSTNSIVPVSFTDIECTWDFETEMTVSFGCPQSRVAFDRLHVEYEKSWMVPEDHFNQNMYYRGDLSVVHGKYVAPTKVSQPNASNTVTEKELTHGGTVRTLAQMNEANVDATTAAPSRK